MINRKNFIIAAIAALIPAKAAAQVQTVGNNGQIVSTGPVWVDQDAAGNQVVTDARGNVIATQAIGNDLQVVSTDSVTVGQRAAGSQTIVQARHDDGFGKGCTPGEWYVPRHGGCLEFCDESCEWQVFCCDCKSGCGKKC